MARNYKGVNLTGDTLMHYRTAGSRNGFSKNPKYRPVGERAKGQVVNGRYVYDNPAGKRVSISQRTQVASASTKGAANNWQEIGTKTAAIHNVGKKLADGASKGNRFGSSTGVSDKDIENLNNVIVRKHTNRQIAKGAKNNWQQQAAANRNMHETSEKIKSGASKSGTMTVDGFDFNVSNHGKTITDYSTARAHQNAINQANAEARARNAIANRGYDKSAKKIAPRNGNSAQNDWQQKANATAGINRPVNDRNIRVVNVTGHINDMDVEKAARKARASNINSVHNAQTERERSLKQNAQKKKKKSLINKIAGLFKKK